MLQAQDLLAGVIRPALELLNEPYDSSEAEVLLVAIALQETKLKDRFQVGGGPAMSFWQIEPPTAYRTVAKWPAGAAVLANLELSTNDLMSWLPWSELGACIVARGILWLEPSPLPDVPNPSAGWQYYAEKCWRPGKPHPELWSDHYWEASRVCGRGGLVFQGSSEIVRS